MSHKITVSQLETVLLDNIDRIGDIEAFLTCAEEALTGADDKVQLAWSAQRVIGAAKKALIEVRNSIDEAATAAATFSEQ